MDEITQQQVATRLKKLPAALHQTLSEEATYEAIARIAKWHQLSRVETGLLAQVTGSLMLGLIKPTEYVASIMDYLSLPHDKASFIAQDINRNVFNQVKDALKEAHAVGTQKSPSSFLRGMAPSPEAPKKPGPVPMATVQSSEPAKPAAPLIRDDWSWHGRRNEATGQLEFAREAPGAIPKNVPPLGTVAAPAHVGSIFEQKLGGTFRMKSEAVEYQAPAPAPETKTGVKLPFKIPMKPKQVTPPPATPFQPPKS